MPDVQTALLALLALGALAAALVTWALVRHAPRSGAADRLARGAFGAVLAMASDQPEDRRAAAIAAKHLLRLDRAAALLDGLLRQDPEDGETLLERGLVAAYAGHHDEADGFLTRAARARADLTESITLHRAWVKLRRGEEAAARLLFEEVEASLESKLRGDLAGDPLFAEWFLQAADLWQVNGRPGAAAWARAEGAAAAPESRLPELGHAHGDPPGSLDYNSGA